MRVPTNLGHYFFQIKDEINYFRAIKRDPFIVKYLLLLIKLQNVNFYGNFVVNFKESLIFLNKLNERKLKNKASRKPIGIAKMRKVAESGAEI